jgi:hypothetical protein
MTGRVVALRMAGMVVTPRMIHIQGHLIALLSAIFGIAILTPNLYPNVMQE